MEDALLLNVLFMGLLVEQSIGGYDLHKHVQFLVYAECVFGSSPVDKDAVSQGMLLGLLYQ
jgi:hypothetical protein